jgi:two-component system, NarL family, response regulator LiaR
MEKIRVLIVDDHAVVRQGLRMFLGLDPDIEVVGEAADGREAIRLTHDLQPQVVLMDLVMPIMNGRTATETIRQQMPEVEVIALTSVLDDASVSGAIRAGAIGYLLKNSDADELRRAIKAAAQGQVHLSPEAAARLVKEIQIPGSPERLTERETTVLRLLARGQANKQIARELKIGEQTVKTHVSNILSKLRLQSRTAAALYAVDRGLVSAGDVGQN